MTSPIRIEWKREFVYQKRKKKTEEGIGGVASTESHRRREVDARKWPETAISGEMRNYMRIRRELK